jgi:bacteriophage N4 adsorption protein B
VSELAAYYAAQYFQLLQYASGFVAVLILLSSVDDLFIDGWYWVREAMRAFTVRRTYRPLTVEQLRTREEQPLAIMVPAWLEYDVIAAMVEDAVKVLDYRNYMIFVGTYANDAKTIEEVERMRRRYRQLRRVEVPHDGPTCKADCLNWVIQAIFAHERASGVEFAGVVLHDSEDVLHSQELRFFNYLLPRKDMIQLPVCSLERHWYELVAGTYMDEFAEWHAKDLVVRESIVGAVPSAGVGTCFSRRALLALCESTDNQPFNTESLTEDYDVGARLAKLGMQSIFARFPVQFRTQRTSWFGFGKTREVIVTMPLCVREFFPDTVRTAYRQRARWTLGIGLQGWAQNGWTGSLANRYLLLRDRKGIVTSFISILAYVLVLQFVAYLVAGALGFGTNLLPSPFIDSKWMIAVLWMNGVALSLRVVQRIWFVQRLYGWEQGFIAVPRMVVGNYINFLAVARAWRLFISHLLTGKRLAWDKTMHDFPSADGLTGDRRQRLGELLLAWQVIDDRQLADALGDEHAHEAPLGRVLMAKGWLDEETLAEAIAFQSDLPRAHLDRASLLAGRARLPDELAIRHRVLMQGTDEKGHAIVLGASPLTDATRLEIEAAIGQPVVQQIVRESEIAAGLRLLRGHDDAFSAGLARVPLIGDLLIELGHVTRERFEATLAHYRPDRDGRIGDFMMARGVITREALDAAIAAQTQARSREAASFAAPPGITTAGAAT